MPQTLSARWPTATGYKASFRGVVKREKGKPMKALHLSMAGLFLMAAAANAGTAPGDWPEPRQNQYLTCVQPLAGRMSVPPALLARYDLGRSRPSVRRKATLPDGTEVELCLLSGALQCYAVSGEKVWECHPKGLNLDQIVEIGDFDGDSSVEIALQAGRPAQPFGAACLVSLEDGALLWRYNVEPMSYAWYFHIGHYLPDTSQKQFVVIMHGYPPDKDNGYIVLFEFLEGGHAPKLKWRYDFDKYTCFPSLLQTDLDGDGIDELAVESHSRMWFLDAHTGELKHFATWDVSPANVRSYGFVKFVDLNGNGREDFLCIADFAQHHEVLLNEDGKMVQAWAHGWPESVTTGKVVTTWPDPPYADLDGDGRIEIVVSMFNSEGEGAWLVRAYDAVTGELEYRSPGLIARQIKDLDGDGAAEILAVGSTDPTQTAVEGAYLLRAAGEGFERPWEDDGAEVSELQKDAFVIEKGASMFSLVVNDGGEVSTLPWSPPETTEIPRPSFVPEIQGPPFPELLIADVMGTGVNQLIVYRNPDVEVLRLTKGHFEVIAAYQSDALPVIADLDGDGRTELVLCTVGPESPPMVEAITPAEKDKVLWQNQFPPAERTGLPQPRRAYMRTGRFTGKATPDVYVWAGTPVVRSVVLDGETGALVWEKGEVPNSERYWGPSVNFASVYDYNADGNEDLVFTNPDYYCVADGPTGEFLLGPLFPPEIFNQPSQGLYTLPAVLERAGEDPLVCLVAGHYFQAAMSIRAEPLWYKLPMAGQSRCAREAFMPLPDGAWLMAFGRQNGDFACVNVADGATRWLMPVEASCSDVAVCDINGDDALEFVFGTSHKGLYAVADSVDAGRVIWRADLSGAAGAPVIGDLDGDGASEVVVPTADGYINVYGLGEVEDSGNL